MSECNVINYCYIQIGGHQLATGKTGAWQLDLPAVIKILFITIIAVFSLLHLLLLLQWCLQLGW